MEGLQGRYLSGYQHRYVFNLNNLLLAALEYCWAILVVLNGNSVYHANAERNYQLLPLSVVMTVVLLVANLLFGRIRMKRRNFMVSAILCLYSLVYFAVMQDQMEAANFLYLFVIGLPCLFLLFAELHRKGKLMGLLYRVCNVVCVLAAMSLFFWVFGVVLDVIQPNMSTRINWGLFNRIQGYWGLHFEIQRDTTFNTLMYRNSGIFAEAPMLNLWTNIALAVELFLREKPSKWRIALLVVTILTTMSTTGIIFIALCIILKYIGGFRKMKPLTKVFLIVVAMIAIPVMVCVIYEVMALKSDTQSYAMRMSDYIGGLKLWMDYPIFGSGYANLRSLLGYIYSPNGVLGFSNSIMGVLSTGGLWMTIPIYGAHIGTMFPKCTGSKSISRFSICYFYLFCTTAFFARYIAVVMVAFGWAVLLESNGKQNAAENAL